MTDRESKLTNDFHIKLTSLKSEIEKINEKFNEKIINFNKINQELQLSLDEKSKFGDNNVNELKKKHELELEDTIRTSNEKYQKMLLENLNKIELIQKENDRLLLIEKEKLSNILNSNYEQEYDKLRVKLLNEKEKALIELRNEMDDKIISQKNELWSKIDKLINDINVKTEDYEKMEAKKDFLIAELHSKIKDLQQNYGNQLGGQEAQLSKIMEQNTLLKEELLDMNSKVMQKDEEITILQNLLKEKSIEITKLESMITSLNEQLLQIRNELNNTNSKSLSSENDLKNKLMISEREAASFRSEINILGTTLANTKDDLKKLEKNTTKTIQENEKKINTLQAEKDILRAKIDELRESANKSNDQANAELTQLKKCIIERENEYKNEKSILLETNKKTIEAMTITHKNEIDSLLLAKQQIIDNYNLKNSQISSNLSEQKEFYEKTLDDVRAESRRIIDEMGERHGVEVDELKSSLTAMEGQLQLITEQNDIEKNNMKNEYNKIDTKLKALQKELDSKKKENERSESVTTSLKNQVESLREELKASQKAFRDKMDLSTAKLEAEWQEKLSNQIELHNTNIDNLTNDLTTKHSNEIKELLALHSDEIKTLKNMLQQESNKSLNELAELEQLRQQLENDLKLAKDEHYKETTHLTNTNNSKIIEMEQIKFAELEKLKKELLSASDSRHDNLVSLHNQEIDKLRKLVESTTSELNLRMTNELELAKQNAEQNLQKSLSSLQEKLDHEKKNELSKQNDAYVNDKNNLIAKYENEKSVLNQELQEIKYNLKESANEISSIQKLILDERKERQRREESFVLERDQLLREHDSDLRKEKESSERKILEVMGRNELDLKLLKQEHNDKFNQYNDHIRELQREYKILEERYRNRESRSEDLQKIKELENEIVMKDDLVQKTKEEMMYFKREMLNREENYNQKFGRTPNVGVMQVLKPKDEAASSGKAKPTQMRVINPNGGGMGIPSLGNSGGIGIGMGIGGTNSNVNLMSSSNSTKSRK